MKRMVLLGILVVGFSAQAQGLFNPLQALGILGGNRAPNTNGPNGQPMPGATSAAVGGAIGGLLGAKSQNRVEGTTLGSVFGLLIGQMMGNNAANGPLPNGPANANLPQIDPATGLPIDPNAPAVPVAPPAIDPDTGLPILAPALPAANGNILPGAPAAPRLLKQRQVNKLFGR